MTSGNPPFGGKGSVGSSALNSDLNQRLQSLGCRRGEGGVSLGLEDTTQPGVPAVYADLAEVFVEVECDMLPPRRVTDCAIKLIPGVKLPKPHMYTMTPREVEELHKYIDKNLARGFIQPSRSHMASTFSQYFSGRKKVAAFISASITVG